MLVYLSLGCPSSRYIKEEHVMNHHGTFGAIALIACSSIALAGPVVDLQPGEFSNSLSGITNSDLSELRGTIEFDHYETFTIDSPSEGDTGSVGMLYEATLFSRVVRSNDTGNLTFNFRIIDPNAEHTGQISHIEINGFDGLQTRVEYRDEAGDDYVGPSIAARSLDGDKLTFDFNTSLASDQSSKFFFAMLDVSDYDFEGIVPQATVYLQSGEQITVDIAPNVPAPGAFALLGTAGLCFARRRR
ncbi:MAG: hypothetical protein CMJ35_05525 [Phycisphaerae bacterium]|nr:hypothetical protein [Phycisphaerae bacterium]MBM91057.1 hypothetical protein [Phycisphaerae bacterium]HCT43768.1 hypothetical protein [Phycisphaerales bacterium]